MLGVIETFDRRPDMAIEFDKVKQGDKVKVVGAGAPGFAKLGDTLEVTRTAKDRVWCKREDGEEAFFALTCGAARLDLVSN
jgi:hypothetical protein